MFTRSFSSPKACHWLRQCCAAGWLILLLLLIASSPVQAVETGGMRVIKFSLADPQGKLHQPSEWQGSKGVVLLFLGTECPISNGYAPEMARLASEFRARGILFYGVHCDPDVTARSRPSTPGIRPGVSLAA